MKKLQVFLNNEWQYVFCRNELKRDPIVTQDKAKALKERDLEYFKNQFGNHEFRISE